MEKEEKSPLNTEFNELLEQAVGMLKEFMEELESKPLNPQVSYEELQKEMSEMGKVLEEYVELNKELFENAEKELKEDEIPKETRRLLGKTKNALEQAEKKEKMLESLMESARKREGKEPPPAENEPVQDPSRKAKTRRLGSKQHWKQL